MMGVAKKGDGLPVEKPTLDAGGQFAGLEGVAMQVDAAADAAINPAAADAVVAPAGPDYGVEAAGAVDMLNAMIEGYAPGAGWDEKTGKRMAESLSPVFEKYGFSFAAAPCELVAAIVCGPVLYQSARVVAAKIQSDRLQQEAARVRAMRGLSDPNTIKGGQEATQAGLSGIGDAMAPENLSAAVAGAPVHPVM
ncbi:MAG: hypothetical protein BGP02_09845 [Pandoraea sp. 64-18]|nr:MAG: hypothetical protein BGP02_09845 [Pandoraea sp. 64-18]